MRFLKALLVLLAASAGAEVTPTAQAMPPATKALTTTSQTASPAPEDVKTLPVLCFHRFGEEDPFDDLKLTPKEFSEQLRWLKASGYHSVTLAQVRDFLDGKGDSLPAKPIVLSIDDGYRSGWTVAGPIMRRYGFKAVYFIIADQIAASANFLNAKDIAALLAAGHEVGCHTSNHSNLGKPARGETPAAYAARLDYELVASRRKLEDRLGVSVTTLAYPYGAYNPYVEALAKKAGYNLIFSVSGGVNIPGDDPARVRRILLAGRVNFGLFKKRIHEKRLQAKMEGMEEGTGFKPEELPHEILIHLPEGGPTPRAELQGNAFKLEKVGDDEGEWKAVLGKRLKPGYYYFRVESGEGNKVRLDSFLFQIYGQHWDNYFAAVSQPLSPSASTLPLKSAQPDDSPQEDETK